MTRQDIRQRRLTGAIPPYDEYAFRIRKFKRKSRDYIDGSVGIGDINC